MSTKVDEDIFGPKKLQERVTNGKKEGKEKKNLPPSYHKFPHFLKQKVVLCQMLKLFLTF